MADSSAHRQRPPVPVPVPQDLDDLIFRWESDVPTVSDR